MPNKDLVVPVIQNVYIVNKRLSANDVILFIAALRHGGARLSDLRTKKQTLVSILETEGFSLDEAESNSMSLKNDAQNIEVYLSPNASGATRVTIAAGKKEYGIHPDYLGKLTLVLENVGFKVTEVPKAKRLYTDRPYDWETSDGRAMLAGYKK